MLKVSHLFFALLFVTTAFSCTTLKMPGTENIAEEELAIVEPARDVIILGYDNHTGYSTKRNIAIPSGKHTIHVYYLSNTSESLNSSEVTVFAEKTQKYTIDAQITGDLICYFVSPETMILERSRETEAIEMPPLSKEIQVCTAEPETDNFEIISYAGYRFDTSSGGRKKLTDKMCLYKLKQIAIKNGADAIMYARVYSASSPNWQRNACGYLIKYTK